MKNYLYPKPTQEVMFRHKGVALIDSSRHLYGCEPALVLSSNILGSLVFQ